MHGLTVQVAYVQSVVGRLHVHSRAAYYIADAGGTVVYEQHEAVVKLACRRLEVIVALCQVECYLQSIVAQQHGAVHTLCSDGVVAAFDGTVAYLHATLLTLVDGKSSCLCLHGVDFGSVGAFKLGSIAVLLILRHSVRVEHHACAVGCRAVAECEVYYLSVHIKRGHSLCFLLVLIFLLVLSCLCEAVVAAEVYFIVVVRTLHEESLERIQEGVVVARAHSLVGVALAVPSCYRTVVAHGVDVVEGCERVTHEVPAGILLVGRGMNVELCVDIQFRQFAEVALFYLYAEGAVE